MSGLKCKVFIIKYALGILISVDMMIMQWVHFAL